MMLTSKQHIQLFRLTVLRQAVKLECLGMVKRGVAASTMVKREFKLPRAMKKIEVLAFLDYHIGKVQREAGENADVNEL